MKKLGLVIVLVVAVGLMCSVFAEPASAFFFGGGSPFGSFFGGAKAGCCNYGCGYAMPYYGWYGAYPAYKCKAWKKKAKATKKAK